MIKTPGECVMDTSNIDLLKQFKHLVAENESLKARLDEYQYIITIKEKEILELRLQIANDNEIKSLLDNQVMELELLQNYIGDMDQEEEGSGKTEMYMQQQGGISVNVKHQLYKLKQQYTYLQTQLNDLQILLQELNNRNLLLQQQASRIAELESFLADAEQERDEWKAPSNLKE